MNAERLHAIARAVRDDLTANEIPSLVDQLVAALNSSVQNPAEPSYQQQVSSLRERLTERLMASRVNEFSDAWWLALEEIGIADLLGKNLRNQIEEIFLRNEITLATAAAEIEVISRRLHETVEMLEQVITGLNGLGIGAEELGLGEFEVGFLIPREAVDNELEQLGKEFVKLDGILGPFMELTGESRPDLEVRSIASSGFEVYVVAFPALAYTMAKVVESLLSSYEKIQNIREKASTLQDDDSVPKEAIEPLISHANERMDLDIGALAKELIAEAAERLAPGREHELEVNVNYSLRQLAERIDEGYSIEVRAFTPPEEDDEAAERLPGEVVDVAKEIAERQPRMRTMNLTGRPILELSEGDDGGPDDGDEEEPPAS